MATGVVAMYLAVCECDHVQLSYACDSWMNGVTVTQLIPSMIWVLSQNYCSPAL